MCQPGRPGPQGLGQAGSPGLLAFHRTKSRGSSLIGVHLDPGPGLHILQALARELAVARETPHPEVDVAVGRGLVGKALVLQAPDEVEDLGDVVRGLGLDLGRGHPQGRHVLLERGDVAGSATSFQATPVSWARRRILSSMSVKFLTQVTS